MKKHDGCLKTLFAVIGALVSLCAAAALAYVLFKKYFQVTFECDGENDEISPEEDPFAEDEDASFEPICCCSEEDEPSEEEEAHVCGCAEEPEKPAE